jgi:hypothetical protein
LIRRKSMENISILDKIIDTKKAEEVARLDAVEIINNLFSELNERERDVIIRRYGLHGQGRETLENIGTAHKLTRERIRQIETSSIRKLQQLNNLDYYISTLKKVICQLLEEHGGLMEREYMLDTLVAFSLDGSTHSKADKNLIHKNYLNFMITKLLHREFEDLEFHRFFLPSYKLKFRATDHLEEILKELLDALNGLKQVLSTVEIMELAKKLESHQAHIDNIQVPGNLDIAAAVKAELFSEDPEILNKHKVLYSILRAAKKISQNKFGHWGLHNSREIKPKTINDKIYLVLKNHRQPLHFSELSQRINQIGFDSKKANPATVHNELILDNKYVLVGRGLYGLKEWGYKKGTVSDVIAEILRSSGTPLSRDEIIDKVLSLRMVKKATIILALMNKERFSKKNGKYILAI